MVLRYTKGISDNYQTVRQILINEFNISYNLLVKLKKSKKIFLNNKETYVDRLLQNGDVVSVAIDFIEDNSNVLPTKMDLNILYEDDTLLILNKPAGIPVHPSILHF